MVRLVSIQKKKQNKERKKEIKEKEKKKGAVVLDKCKKIRDTLKLYL